MSQSRVIQLCGGPAASRAPLPTGCTPPSRLHFGPFICCVLLFGGSLCRAGKAAQCRQEEEEEEEEGWGEAMPELCQMWERREGGNAFAAASRRVGDPPPPPPPFPILEPPRSLPECHRSLSEPASGRASLGRFVPPMAAWVGGWRVGCRWLFPPAAFPALASLHPPHCSRPGGREEEQGQGPACGRRPCRRGRQEGEAGKAGVGKRAVGWSRLSCWSSSSSRLPVCPCSSRAAKAGCTPGGRSRSALPWRGAASGPTSASRASAADVVPGGCSLRAAGSAPCRSAPSAAAAACASLPTSARAPMESRASPAQVPARSCWRWCRKPGPPGFPGRARCSSSPLLAASPSTVPIPGRGRDAAGVGCRSLGDPGSGYHSAGLGWEVASVPCGPPVRVSEPPGTCGEYGCDLSCNHGGCQEVARVCPLGFSMVETPNGVRCTGEPGRGGPGGMGESRRRWQPPISSSLLSSLDIDECLSAACEGLCVNTEGGFVCECGPGMQLSADRHTCQDTDECLATPCQHRCKNSIGSYRCSCRPGYHLHGNRHSCVDVNECRRPGERRACQHACHNTPGSYLCSCRPGYRLSGDRVSCEGYPKSILAPSPILQSLQHPPTLVLLPPGSGGPLLAPRGSPSPYLPAAAPGTQLPSSSPAPASPATEPSPRAVAAPGTSTPSAPRCWYRGAPREPGARWIEPGCRSCACQVSTPSSPCLSLPHQPDVGLSRRVPSQGGRVLCEAVSCPVTCSHPLPTPAGGCCPSCSGCLHDGVARAEGDVFSPSDGNCTICVCLAGNVSCISPECPPGSCPSASPADCCSCQPAKCSFRGRTYSHGARFSLDGDDCTTCVCRGGEVECSFAPCPVLDCPQHQRHLGPGQCCFTCRDPPAPAGEPVLGGTRGRAGWDGGGRQLVAGREGCRGHLRMGRAGCGGRSGMGKVGGWEYLGTGRVGCRGHVGTGRARGSGGAGCGGAGGLAGHWGGGCTAMGFGYRMGTAHMSSSACTCLSVHQEGEGLGVPVCPPVSVPLPKVASWMTTGWSFPSDRSGLRAIPADGSVSCKRTDCVETCPYPIRIPGQCCPDCSAGCTYMGRIFYNNETFPSVLDPCLSCICLLGSVACSPVDCAIFCTYPFHPEGECCPVCNDCNYQGRKVVNGQTFTPEGQPCTRCTCQLGEVSCEKRLCPRSCAEPAVMPAACCPPCQATDVRLPLQRSHPSLSPTHKDSPAGTPHPSPPTSTQPPRHRLAQLLLPNTAPLGPSPGNAGAGDPPPTTLSPPGHPPTAAVPPDTPSEAAAPPAPTGSPSSSPEGQGPPGDADPSAVPPASG
ncbi:von Willebrand factor C and EGF domain-containing protein isoform 3-T3 [Morphnus guianensis]